MLVAAELLGSVDGPDDERTDEDWLAEVNRRAERVRMGEANGKPWSHLRDELLADLFQPQSSGSDAVRLDAPEVE